MLAFPNHTLGRIWNLKTSIRIKSTLSNWHVSIFEIIFNKKYRHDTFCQKCKKILPTIRIKFLFPAIFTCKYDFKINNSDGGGVVRWQSNTSRQIFNSGREIKCTMHSGYFHESNGKTGYISSRILCNEAHRWYGYWYQSEHLPPDTPSDKAEGTTASHHGTSAPPPPR